MSDRRPCVPSTANASGALFRHRNLGWQRIDQPLDLAFLHLSAITLHGLSQGVLALGLFALAAFALLALPVQFRLLGQKDGQFALAAMQEIQPAFAAGESRAPED